MPARKLRQIRIVICAVSGSINLARIDTKAELEEIVDLASLFLLAGTVSLHVPYSQVRLCELKADLGFESWEYMNGFSKEINTPGRRFQMMKYMQNQQSWLAIPKRHNLSDPI